MNKKGFTLVELLAVIVVITIIALIGTVSINVVRNKIEENLFNGKIETLLTAAQTYGENNKNEFTAANGYTIDHPISPGFLIQNKYYKTDETNSDGSKAFKNMDGTDIKDSLKIVVKRVNNRISACLETSDTNKSLLDYNKFEKHYCK